MYPGANFYCLCTCCGCTDPRCFYWSFINTASTALFGGTPLGACRFSHFCVFCRSLALLGCSIQPSLHICGVVVFLLVTSSSISSFYDLRGVYCDDLDSDTSFSSLLIRQPAISNVALRRYWSFCTLPYSFVMLVIFAIASYYIYRGSVTVFCIAGPCSAVFTSTFLCAGLFAPPSYIAIRHSFCRSLSSMFPTVFPLHCF